MQSEIFILPNKVFFPVFRSGSFRDLHGDQPDATPIYSSSLSENSEPSFGTKHAADELRIELQTKKRRPAATVQPDELSSSQREMQCQSQQMAAHDSRVPEPSTTRQKIHCDRINSRTSSEVSDSQCVFMWCCIKSASI